jgi:hypothetical protein
MASHPPGQIDSPFPFSSRHGPWQGVSASFCGQGRKVEKGEAYGTGLCRLACTGDSAFHDLCLPGTIIRR